MLKQASCFCAGQCWRWFAWPSMSLVCQTGHYWLHL